VRALLVVLLIFAAFGAALVWQSGTMDRLLSEHAERRGVRAGGTDDPTRAPLPAGWGVVVLGDPSGAEPVEPVHARGAARALPKSVRPGELLASPAEAARAWQELEARALADYEITVRAGMTLSQLARAHYGEASTAIVEALAHYNGLDSPDALEAGTTLRLPERERLVGASRPDEPAEASSGGRLLN